MSEELTEPPPISPYEIEKAINITYVQSVLSSAYVALTSGMFVVGFALALGASNVQIGLMTTIPMAGVVTQLLGSWLVQRGMSRRHLTAWLSFPIVLAWMVLIAVPHLFPRAEQSSDRAWFMIGLLGILALLGNITANARSSWLADLLPPRRLGEFFAKSAIYGSLLGIVSTLAGSTFLDHIRRVGISGFNGVFIAASIIGVVNALLFFPQADVPIKPHKSGSSVIPIIRDAFREPRFVSMVIFMAVWSGQMIAAPFSAAYMLRDLKAPYLYVALVNSVIVIMSVLSSGFWGRKVDRFGCRPVLVACSALLAPLVLVWMWVDTPARILYLLIPVNVAAGFAVAGVVVAMNALVVAATKPEGRAVHYAVYAVCVTLLSAPLPTLGGYLPKLFHSIGIGADLRCTFYAAHFFILLSIFAARRLCEPNARRVSELLRDMPLLSQVMKPAPAAVVAAEPAENPDQSMLD